LNKKNGRIGFLIEKDTSISKNLDFKKSKTSDKRASRKLIGSNTLFIKSNKH